MSDVNNTEDTQPVEVDPATGLEKVEAVPVEEVAPTPAMEEVAPLPESEPTPVEPEPELSPEQEKVNEQMEALKAFLEKQVDALYAEGFPMYVVDTASDLYKSWCKIKMGKTKEFDTFKKTREEAEEKFFSLNSNELTPYEETSDEKMEAKADSVGV